jgi:ubiquinone biosynthesis protein
MDLINLSGKKREWARVLEIISVLSRYGLAGWLGSIPSDAVRDIVSSAKTRAIGDQPWETRVRLALTELGTTFIKLGQMLSTRGDLIGPELAAELSKLQSRTPADPPEIVRAAITEELGQPPEAIFASFEPVAIASASIGQVHRASLSDGTAVVVKVQHAGIVDNIRSDLDVMVNLAELVEKYVAASTPYRPVAMVQGFKRTLLRELDFNNERRHLEEFRKNFADDDTVHFPEPFDQYSSRRVLTMEFLDGPSGSDQVAIHQSGGDLDEFATRAANLYLHMIFRDGFYHADPHPGNYVMMAGGVVGVLDGGMVGRIDNSLRESLEDLLLAISRRDNRRVSELLMQTCEAPTGIDPAAFRADVGDFLADYANQSFQDFDLGGALQRLTEIIRRHRLVMPSGASLLLKTLAMLESTAKQLSPSFNLMELIEPMQSKLMLQRFKPERWAAKLRSSYYDIDRLITNGPRDLADILQQMRAGRVTVKHEHQHLQTAVNRLVIGLLAAALFVGSTQLCLQPLPPALGGVSVPGIAGCLLAVLMGGRLVRQIMRDPI